MAGIASPGLERQGIAGNARRGTAGNVEARIRETPQAGQVAAWSGLAWRGMAGMAWTDAMCHGKAGEARRGMPRQGRHV